MKQIGLIGAVTVAALSVLAGCATPPPPPTTEEQQIAEVLNRMNDATALAVNAQRELALTADAKIARESLLRQRLLTDVVSYDFYGDVETIVREIATKYSYEFATYGKRPAGGVMVNVFVNKRPALDVLKHIGYQSTAWLDIKLKKDVIELHYTQGK